MNHEILLGDGLYASYDGYRIWLATLTAGRLNRISLDEAQFRALGAYARSIPAAKAPATAHA